MAALRGRAASPIRPGILCKRILEGRIPLIADADINPEGAIVTESCVRDLHATYKALLARENVYRPRQSWMKGMTYGSFVKMFAFARLLGMVYLVREEPMLFPPTGGSLYRVSETEEGKRRRVVKSNRRVFALTDIGKTEEAAWLDLTKAWKDHWTIPSGKVVEVPEVPTHAPVEQPVEEAMHPPVEVPPAAEAELPQPVVKRRRGRPRKIPLPIEGTWQHVELADTPSRIQFGLLARQLRQLMTVQIDEAVAGEVSQIVLKLGIWVNHVDDLLTRAVGSENIVRTSILQDWKDQLTEVMDMCYEYKFKDSAFILEALATAKAPELSAIEIAAPLPPVRAAPIITKPRAKPVQEPIPSGVELWKPLTLPERPSPKAFRTMADHIEKLLADIRNPAASKELDRMESHVGTWVIEGEDLIADAKAKGNDKRVEQVEAWNAALNEVEEDFTNSELADAVAKLRAIGG